MKRSNFFLVSCLFFFSFFSAQNRVEWLKAAPYKVGNLDPVLHESSGLTFQDSKLYSFNDGGNPSALYEINPNNGALLSTSPLPMKNKDWEAISSDGEFFYIGDFGNNAGNRKDLKIYKVMLNGAVPIDTLSFSYPEQKDFLGPLHRHNFDAESLIIREDTLSVFTKEWKSLNTTRYDLVWLEAEGLWETKKKETFSTGYLVTDAAHKKGKLYLVGYTKKMEVYLSVFSEDKNGNFFSSTPKKYFLGLSSKLGQVEGITVDEHHLYISSERFIYRFLNAPASLFRIPLEKLK